MRLIVITALILSAYFIPASFIVRPEYLLVTALGTLGLFSRGRYLFETVGKELLLLYALGAAAGFSLLFQILLGNPVIPRDFMILLRYLIYSFALLSGAYAAFNLKAVWPVKLLLVFLVLGSIAISFFQYFNILGINKIMVPLYGMKYQTLVTGMSWRRIIGTIGNANYWGLWLALCFSVCSYLIVIKKRFLFIPIAFFLFLSIVMTGSRTAMLASLLGPSVGISVILKYLPGKSENKRIILQISLVSIFLLLLFGSCKVFIRDYYENSNRYSLKNTHTLELRLKHWANFLDEIYQQPYQILVGRGPTKGGAEVTYGDNSYLMIFRDYGFISISLFFSFLIAIYKKITRSIVSPGHGSAQAFPIALTILTTFVVFDLAADAWFNVRLVIPLLFGYGYLMGKKGLELSTISEQPC